MTTTPITRLRGRESDDPQTSPVTARDTDAGYTLIELILVILILGVITAGVVLSVSGLSTEAAESACSGDRRAVATAVETYFAQHGEAAIPATGTGTDRYEQTLVATGLIRGVSEQHHVAEDGAITPEADSQC